MRRTKYVMLAGAAAATALAGCGGGKQFANNPRPPAPVDLTIYINDSHVSVSPQSLGAGPIIFIVTNQASHSESLQIKSAGGASGQPVETGPINPQATATVKADLQPGDYIVGTNDAATAGSSAIQPAQLHLGKSRPSADNLLLQP
jgi:hypothetical protein